MDQREDREIDHNNNACSTNHGRNSMISLNANICYSNQVDDTKTNLNSNALVDHAPDGLPPGWTKEIRPRLKAKSKTQMDAIYIDPVDGYEFRSLKDVFRYVKTGDIWSCATKPIKREGKLASKEELNLPASTSRTSQVETAVQICHFSEEKPDMKFCEEIGQFRTKTHLHAQDQTAGPATVDIQQPESISEEKFELAEEMKMDGHSEQRQDDKKIKRGHQPGSKQNKTINTIKLPVRASKRLAALRADDLGESGVDEIYVMSDFKQVPNEQLLLSSLSKDFNHSSKLKVGIVDAQCLSAAPSHIVLEEGPDTKSVGLEANKLLQAVDNNLSAEKVNSVEKMNMEETNSEHSQPTKVSRRHRPVSKRNKIMMPVRASKRLAVLKSDTPEKCGSENCDDDMPMSNNKLEANLINHGNEFPMTTLELEHGCVTEQKTKEPLEIGSAVLDVKVVQPEGEDCLAGKIKLVEETMVELNSDKLSHHNKPHKTLTQCSEKVLNADDLGDSIVDEFGAMSDSKQVPNEQLLQSSLAKDFNHGSKLTVGIVDVQCLSAAPSHIVLEEDPDTKSIGLEANKLLQAVDNNLTAEKVNSVEKMNMEGTSSEHSQPTKASRGHQPGSKRNKIMMPVRASKRLAALKSETPENCGNENCEDDMPMSNNQLEADPIKDFLYGNEFPTTTLEHGCVTDQKPKELPEIVSAVLDVQVVHPGEDRLAVKIKLAEEAMVELNGDEQSHNTKPHKTLTQCSEKNQSIKATTIPVQESKQLVKAEGFVKSKINDISSDVISTSNHSEVNVSKDNQSKYTMAARRLEELSKSPAATERLEERCKTPTATERIEEWPKSPVVAEILGEQFKFQLASEKFEECSISEVSSERLEECSKSHLVIERTGDCSMSAVPTERLEEQRVELVIDLEHQEKSDKTESCYGDATRKQVELGRIDNQKRESQFMSPLGDSWPDPCIEFAFKTLIGDKKESCVGDATQKQVELGSIDNRKTESQFMSPFGDSWPDPCIEFAFKTLVGDIKESYVGDATRKQVELERIDNQKTESQYISPFGDSWPDPCIEFAFKTLVGDIPDAFCQQQQQQPDPTAIPNNSSNPYTHIKSGSLDQDEALSHFGLWDDHLWSFRDEDIPCFFGNDMQSTKNNG